MIGKALASIALAISAPAQTTPPRPAFEVASVKLNTNNGDWDQVPRRSGDRVILHNTQLGKMVNYAYRIRYNYQIAGNLDLPTG
jgi:hypothetical protein